MTSLRMVTSQWRHRLPRPAEFIRFLSTSRVFILQPTVPGPSPAHLTAGGLFARRLTALGDFSLGPSSTCFDLLWICCTTSCTTSWQEIESLQLIHNKLYNKRTVKMESLGPYNKSSSSWNVARLLYDLFVFAAATWCWCYVTDCRYLENYKLQTWCTHVISNTIQSFTTNLMNQSTDLNGWA